MTIEIVRFMEDIKLKVFSVTCDKNKTDSYVSKQIHFTHSIYWLYYYNVLKGIRIRRNVHTEVVKVECKCVI